MREPAPALENGRIFIPHPAGSASRNQLLRDLSQNESLAVHKSVITPTVRSPPPAEGEDPPWTHASDSGSSFPPSFRATVVKVGTIGPDSEGVSFHAKVVGVAVEVQRESAGGTVKAADVCVGDETGCIMVTATGDQVDLMQPGKSVALRSVRVMRLLSPQLQRADSLRCPSLRAEWLWSPPSFSGGKYLIAAYIPQIRVEGGYIRIVVDRWGLLERLEPGLTCEVDRDNTRSLVQHMQEGTRSQVRGGAGIRRDKGGKKIVEGARL